ncbi:MAG: Asp-tRNA(Asn)/Glu-tRNA(Gln) amidotransferase subunit GatA [Acidimicrobiales bacterium]|nr:Asp-tRNA(Asn)/Glu-tRNA(Gln) amidotransferase subunit GatA [Acidimicrobiales bacterium]
MEATEIAEKVSSGEVSARSVVEHHIETINKIESDVNAFNLVTAEQALIDADEIDSKIASGETLGPLAGVPISIKDNLCTRGVETTCSSKILEGWKPPYNATVIEKLKEAGAVVMGKTNLDEFAMGSSTENSAFGPTRNPHNLELVPGGSSGGSAAAVAAGFSPLALGSDTGGSIRQPAALCGVVGVKPTYGRVSRYGLVAFASSLDQVGPFANTVSDAALTLEVISGHDPRASTSIPEKPLNISEVLNQGVDGMRIGVIEELSGKGLEGISPDVSSRVEEAIKVFSNAGAIVESASVPASIYGLSAYYVIAPAEASSNLARYDGIRFGPRTEAATTAETMTATRTKGFGDEVKRRIMLGTYALSAGYYDAYYGKSQRVRTLIMNDFAKAYEKFDILISPTAPTTAFPLGDKTADPMQMYLQDVCTIPSNLAGHPAMSVPFGVGEDGMPVGIQILAPAMAEREMFQAAKVLESESGKGIE